MEELRRLANAPIWDQGETEIIFGFPLPTNKDFTEAGAKLALGIPADQLYMVGPFQATRSPNSHLGPYKWAVDFLVPDGTEVLAAEHGEIIEIVDNFYEWGPTEAFRGKLNYLTILHSNGEYSQYCHLAPHSVRAMGLKIGEQVNKGQLIARVGKTGWTDRDHCHFIVFRADNNPFGFKSLKVRFNPE